MKYLNAVLFLLLSPMMVNAQWTAKQNLGSGNERTFATSFSINNKIYVIGGQTAYVGRSDVWEYDITGNTWLQKNSFPGGIRGGAVAFSIGGKGYLTCGSNYVGQYFDDLWQYDPGTDSWQQKNNFPGGKREEAVGFVINNKAYVGTGYMEVVGPNSTFFITYSDFYEYQPLTDTWVSKALFPGAQRGWAIGSSVGGKGYVGLGSNSNQNASYNNFYEYDPTNNAWLAKAPYNLAVGDAMSFNLNGKVYVAGGINFGTSVQSAQMRSYDPATNTWSVEAGLPAGATMGGVAVNAGNRVFAGTGYNPAFSEKNDWWEFVATGTVLCQAPMSFSTTTYATNGTAQCDGMLVVSDILNGCAPYTFSVFPANSALIQGSGTSFTASPLCAGNYSVYLSDANCCGTVYTTAVIQGNLSSGIAETNNASTALSVFPNPSSGVFTLSFTGGLNEGLHELKVINAIGQETKSRWQVNNSSVQVEMADAVPGIYIVCFSSGSRHYSCRFQHD